jgi:hypothetical protein
MRDKAPSPQLKDPLKEVACEGNRGSPTQDKATMDVAKRTSSKDQKRQGVKCKAPKQKPLTKPIRPIGDHVAKKMKAWDVITKQTNCCNDGPKFEKSDPHDGSNPNDELDSKPLSKYVVPKVATKVQEWSKDSIQPISIHTKGVETCNISAKN